MIEITEILQEIETHILVVGWVCGTCLVVIAFALMGIGQELKKLNSDR